MRDYIIEPEEDLGVIVPRTLHSAGSKPNVYLLNLTDRSIKLKRNQLVAKAFPVGSVLAVPVDDDGGVDSSMNVDSLIHDIKSDLIQVQTDDSGDPVGILESSDKESVAKTVLSEITIGHAVQEQVNVAEVSEPLHEQGSEMPSEPRELPGHLKDLFQRSIEHLNAEEQVQLADLLIEYEDVFAQSEFDLGNFSDIVHTIDTGSSKPVKQRMRRTPACFVGEEEAHLDKMIKAGVIQPSVSEWASAPVLVRKRDGTVRWCVDYRALNSVTTKDVFPLPLVEDCLDTLAGNKWFSKLDANSAYWQVKISEPDQKKTAFITKYGLFEHVRMGFGLCKGPATYSRVMNLILSGLLWSIVLAFLDDILVLGSMFLDHLRHIREVLQRFRRYQLKLKPKKCVLFQKKVDFLGRIVSEEGIKLSETDIKAVLDWPVPQSTREVEQFLGLANYHRNFIKNFSRIAVPLYRLTGKNPFEWSEDHQHAFEDLKGALTSVPVLGLPNNSDPFILDTDSSNYAIGGELIQVQDGEERVIAYGSYALTPEQINYCTTRKELLAVVRFSRQFRHYLLGRQFLVRTDHSSLRWLLNFKELDGQLARWLEELSQYDMIVKHRAGKKHENADSLSRVQQEDHKEECSSYRLGVKPEDLPCGGCKKCAKAHENWSRFTEEVDDVVSLTCRQVAVESTIIEAQSASTMGLEAQHETMTFRKGLETVECLWPWDPDDRKAEQSCLEHDGEGHIDLIGDSTGEMLVCRAPHMHDSLLDEEPEDVVDSTDLPMVSEVTPGNPPDKTDLLDDLKNEQQEDADLEPLRRYLLSKEETSENSLAAASPAAKYYWINRDLFILEGGLVWRRSKYKDQTRRVVIPGTLQSIVLEMCHNIPAAGHQGVQGTTAKVKEKYFWYRMSERIKNYVETCDVCSRNKKPNRNARCPLTQFRASAPLERVHIDFLGPLPKTDRGNEHILMIVDQFTKWVECLPLPSQTAEVTAQAVMNDFSRFGYSFQILSDQGRNFESKLFSALCDAMQIQKTKTTPYRPSTNG